MRVVLMLALAWSAPRGSSEKGEAPHWSYEGEHGPAHWAALEPAYAACGTGTQQSPIDIRDAQAADLPPLTFDYHPSPLTLVDNGHTIQTTYAPGSVLEVGGRRYALQQLHFHHPSEERVNGRSYPLVAHLVHRNAEGQLAVVAVLLDAGDANPLVDALWAHLPAAQGAEVRPEGVTVDARQLLPSTLGYYTFTGSLTTPPCTEGVTWFVLKTPRQVSKAEVQEFARRYPHNARPVQPLHGRVVRMTR
jgi:carbonic anhydrase